MGGGANVFGAGLDSLADLRDRVADMGVVAGVRPCRLVDGPENNVLVVDVWTGSGLEYSVVPDRGMNICNFRYKGIPLEWRSGTGLVSPLAYDPDGWRWLRSFNGGLLHTCGLDNVGEPCRIGDNSCGAHGRISSTQAKEVAWNTDGNHVAVSGKCRSVSAIGESMALERTVSSETGGMSILVTDTVRNIGPETAPFFLLYHCNFGFPLLSEASVLSLPAEDAVGSRGEAVPDPSFIAAPMESGDEQVFHPLVESEEAMVSLFNPGLADGLGVAIKYKTAELPHLTIWKYFRKRSYVLGIEPGTCRVGGRDVEEDKDRAVYLEPDEAYSVRLEIEVMA